jgi:cytoskeletal protein RodZ
MFNGNLGLAVLLCIVAFIKAEDSTTADMVKEFSSTEVPTSTVTSTKTEQTTETSTKLHASTEILSTETTDKSSTTIKTTTTIPMVTESSESTKNTSALNDFLLAKDAGAENLKRSGTWRIHANLFFSSLILLGLF